MTTDYLAAVFDNVKTRNQTVRNHFLTEDSIVYVLFS
jgi:hypothetical protein